MARISVAMCTFNGEKYLVAQLASIAQQTLKPAELVVCDDGSSDATQALVQSFASSAPFPVRWIGNPSRQGYRQNFMNAAHRCTSDLIAFCDQDDVWCANKLERAAVPFVNPEVMLTYHQVSLIDRDGTLLGNYGDRAPRTNPVEYPHCDPWLFGLGFTLMFRNKLCLAEPLWPLSRDYNHPLDRLAHDQWFFFLALAFGQIVYIEESLALYRQHERNLFGAGGDLGPRPNSYRQRMLMRHSKNSSHAAACSSNAALLAKLSNLVEPHQIKKIEQMIERYLKLEKMFRLSANIAEPYSLAQKLHDVWRLRRMGSYTKGALWSFERRDPLRDLITCLASQRADYRIAP